MPAMTRHVGKLNYKTLTTLTKELVDACSGSTKHTAQIAGVLLYVLDAVKNDRVEEATKEKSLDRFLSAFEEVNQTGDVFDQSESGAMPVRRTVAKASGKAFTCHKSTREIKSSKRKSCTPVKGTMNRTRKCVFCGSGKHTVWKQCLLVCRASELNAKPVEATKEAYRDFVDRMCTSGQFSLSSNQWQMILWL